MTQTLLLHALLIHSVVWCSHKTLENKNPSPLLTQASLPLVERILAILCRLSGACLFAHSVHERRTASFRPVRQPSDHLRRTLGKEICEGEFLTRYLKTDIMKAQWRPGCLLFSFLHFNAWTPNYIIIAASD